MKDLYGDAMLKLQRDNIGSTSPVVGLRNAYFANNDWAMLPKPVTNGNLDEAERAIQKFFLEPAPDKDDYANWLKDFIDTCWGSYSFKCGFLAAKCESCRKQESINTLNQINS